MPLTNEQIRTIAEWQPIQVGFGRDEAQTAIRIKSIVDQINSWDEFRCEILEDDGLSNYFALFAFTKADVLSRAVSCQVEGLLIYLSACGPLGVVGRSQRSIGRDFSSHGPLQIETLLIADQIDDWLAEKTFEAIHSNGYELLTLDEVSKPLPPGVKPFEYCFSPEPWDRVFHALFGNTD